MAKDSSTTVLLLVAVLVLAGGLLVYVLSPSETAYKETPNATATEREREQDKPYMSLEGLATAFFEGEQTLPYIIRAEAGAALQKQNPEGTLVSVVKNGRTLATLRFSYEGGRGYGIQEYISSQILASNQGAAIGDKKTPSRIEWTEVNSGSKQWQVASVKNGAWIIAIEVDRSRLAAMERMIEDFQAFE